jgi:hypothetical protein
VEEGSESKMILALAHGVVVCFLFYFYAATEAANTAIQLLKKKE